MLDPDQLIASNAVMFDVLSATKFLKCVVPLYIGNFIIYFLNVGAFLFTCLRCVLSSRLLHGPCNVVCCVGGMW